MGRDFAPQTFRPRAEIRWVVLGADYFWLFILFALIALRGASDAAFVGTAFFIALFTVCGLFYSQTAIVVTADGVVYRGLVERRMFGFDEILRVQARPGLVGTDYDVMTRRGLMQFSSIFKDHKRLFDLIVERAGLLSLN